MKRNKQINKILNKIFVYRYVCTFVYFITGSYNAKEKKGKKLSRGIFKNIGNY